jgi:hypothetical protein
MKNRTAIDAGWSFLCAGILALSATARADSPVPFAVSLTAGTLGAGADLVVSLTTDVNFRGGLNVFESKLSNITPVSTLYTDKLKLQTVPLLVDWYPGGTRFRASAGLMIDNNHVNFTSVPGPNGLLVLNNDSYTQTQVNSLGGNVNFNRVAPYLGIGYGNALDTKGHWTWSVDIGGIWQGTPKVSYESFGTSTSGSTGTAAMYYTDVNVEMNRLSRHYDRMEYYPNLALGVAYKF